MKNVNAKLTPAEQGAYKQALNACGHAILKVAGYRSAVRTVQSIQRFAEGTAVTVHPHGRILVDGHKCGYPFSVLVVWAPVRDRRAEAWVRAGA